MKAVDYNLVDHKDVLKQIKDIFFGSIQIFLYYSELLGFFIIFSYWVIDLSTGLSYFSAGL
jgi:hypothetical protein